MNAKSNVGVETLQRAAEIVGRKLRLDLIQDGFHTPCPQPDEVASRRCGPFLAADTRIASPHRLMQNLAVCAATLNCRSNGANVLMTRWLTLLP